MITDVYTIMWKELKEIFVQRGSLRAGLANVLIVIGIAGVIFPLQYGRDWIESPIGAVTTSWLPMFMAMGLIADAFAGERERHTLETLLASRLSDGAILAGKMLAAVAYGIGIIFVSLLAGALVVNLSAPGVGFYSLQTFFGALLFALLGIVLVAGIGVQVSLHANNVRQAYQKMSLGFMLLWLPLILGPQVMPESWKGQIGRWLTGLPVGQTVAAVLAVLILLDAALIFIAAARFRRAQMILD